MITQTKKNQELDTLFPEFISLFPSATCVQPMQDIELGVILEWIRDGRWKKEIEEARAHKKTGKHSLYDAAKRKLPALTISTYLKNRSKLSDEEKNGPDPRINSHSGYLQGDFDQKENGHIENAADARDLLIKDPYVAFAFVSPSGDGVKIGIKIDPAKHEESFLAAESHFFKKGFQMDRSTKDPTRLCFVSYDSDLRINPDARQIPVIQSERNERNQERYFPEQQTDAADIAEMLECIPTRPDYDEWLRIINSVFSSGLSMETCCSLLNAWSREETPGEYASKWQSRLNEITIGTLIYHASRRGFDYRAASEKKRWAGRIRFGKAKAKLETPEREEIREVITLPFIRRCFNRGQRGDAELFAAMVGRLSQYDHFAKVWRVYSAGIWERDDLRKTFIDLAEKVSDGYNQLIKTIREEMRESPQPKSEGQGRPKKDARIDEIEQINTRIAKMNQAGYLSSVEKFAESLLATKATEFDKRLDLIVLEGQTIDFGQGLVREHRHTDYVTYRIPTRFEAGAECPRWLAFLDFFMGGDQEKIEYLARAVGYSLTGYVDRDALFFCYGKGANGKSTFTSALKLLAGPYMTTVSIDALLTKSSDNNFDYKKAEMEGKRIVVTDEIPENKTLNDSAIKSLVGGDSITARRPFEKPYAFDPTHKLWLVGNHKPTVKGTDHGIWRRIHLIPWLVTMPEQQRRPRHEVIAEFRQELPGILNWAMRGYQDMVENGGLLPPSSVVDATESYRTESDQVANFLDERTARREGEQMKAQELFTAYAAWCADNGEIPRFHQSKGLIGYLKDHGFSVKLGRSNLQYVSDISVLIPETLPEKGHY